MKEYMTPREIADLMGIHVRTVYRWIEKGVLGCYNFGPQSRRISKDQFTAFLASKEKSVNLEESS